MSQNKSVEETAQAIQDLYFERGATVDMPSWTETMKLLTELTQTSHEREREIVEAILEESSTFDNYNNTRSYRAVPIKEIEAIAQKYNITITNPNKD